MLQYSPFCLAYLLSGPFLSFSQHNLDNLAIAKGIVSQLCPDVQNGSDLLKRMTEYADAGISLLRVEYENNGTLRLDNYIE